MAGLGALIVIIIAVCVLLAIEAWGVQHDDTISEDTQRLTARMDRQMIAGISFGLGAIVMWFLYHFTSPPPT